MKRQGFEALGIEIQLKDNQFFYDEGASGNILRKTAEVAHRRHAYIDSYTSGITNNTRGICHSFPRVPIPEDFSGEQHVHIIYEEGSGLIIRAHEETHAIDYLSCGNQLHAMIIKEFGLSPKTNIYLNPWGLEGCAIIGSIFALHRRGLSLVQILGKLEEKYNLSVNDFRQLFPPFGRV